jgi:hypothetical protein
MVPGINSSSLELQLKIADYDAMICSKLLTAQFCRESMVPRL